MSGESVIDKINISQSGRWYRWSVHTPTIPKREKEKHSANMPLILATVDIKNIIDKVGLGDIIRMSGNLVRVTSGSDAWVCKSFETRNDTGAGACELIFVDKFQIITP